MSVISLRRIPRRHKPPVALESLESRALLAAHPVAVGDAYSVAQGQTLAASFARNYLVATVSGSADPYTWTTADGPVAVYNAGTGDVMVYAGVTTDPTTGWSVILQTSSGLPLQPGAYVAGGPGTQNSLSWSHGGIHHQDGQFTIQQVEFDQGNYVTRVDADFVADGGDSGSVHYSGGTRGVLDNDLGPAVGVTASLLASPVHGSLSFNPDGTFAYTPAPGFAGDDSFTYAASDGTTTSAPATVTLHVLQTNVAPSFTKGPDVVVNATEGPQFFPQWATNLSAGPSPTDAGQFLWFSVVGNSNPSLFAAGPSVDLGRNLTFTPAPGASGTATISLVLHDSGGTANGGRDTSVPQTFTITLAPAIQFNGAVMDVYDQPNGTHTTPLVGRTVFDDADGDGQVDPGEATAVTNLNGQFALSLPPGTHTVRLVPKAGWVTPAGYRDSVTADASTLTDLDLYTTMANPVVIDVLAVHPAPVSIFDQALPWDGAIRNAFAAANAIFANSDTNVRLHLVGVESVKYVPADDLQLDLARLYKKGDGALDTVLKRRDALKADLAVLFDPREDAIRRAGIAFELNPARPDASRGYAVVVAGSDAPAAGAVLAHEVGHTLGADHDAANGPKNYVSYAHGYRFTGDDGIVYHDVMAYPPGTTLPFFSSPGLSYAGHALGVAGVTDNARAVRENAYAVASYRGAAVLAPGSVAVSRAAVTRPTARPGDAVTARATVRNSAASKFSGKVSVAYYLSEDKALDASDTLIKRTTVTARNLAGKRTVASSVAFKVDATLAAGTYYVLAVATPTGAAADERAAKAASAALKVAQRPAKKKARAKAARFQSARPIGEQVAAAERSSDGADDVITGMLRSPR